MGRRVVMNNKAVPCRVVLMSFRGAKANGIMHASYVFEFVRHTHRDFENSSPTAGFWGKVQFWLFFL
jgi:hypothetical protein